MNQKWFVPFLIVLCYTPILPPHKFLRGFYNNVHIFILSPSYCLFIEKILYNLNVYFLRYILKTSVRQQIFCIFITILPNPFVCTIISLIAALSIGSRSFPVRRSTISYTLHHSSSVTIALLQD